MFLLARLKCRPQTMRTQNFPVSNGNLDAHHQSRHALQTGSEIKCREPVKSSQPIKSRPDVAFEPIKKQEKTTFEAVVEPQVVNSLQVSKIQRFLSLNGIDHEVFNGGG